MKHKRTSTRYSTFIWKGLILFGFFIGLKLLWDSIASTRNSPLALDDYVIETGEQVLSFHPRSCVFANGNCQTMTIDHESFMGKGLYAKKNGFYLNGKPFTIYSGTFHYFRTHPLQWEDRLLKIKAAGLNTVETYIPWNFHEPHPKTYLFSGMADIVSFIKQVKAFGLYLIIRPGPYICAEWDFGGLPSWLLHDPSMQVRTSRYHLYLKHVEEYFDQLLPKINAHSYKNGGPIIAYQIENEFGAFGNDPEYLMALVKMYEKWNINELLLTSDASFDLKTGSIHNVLASINFQSKPAEHFKRLKEFQPDKPLFVAEYWSGWFDHWSEKHHITTTITFEESVRAVLSANASINFYVFVGGTNFEFWNGANNHTGLYQPTVTSYDYDAPISEAGDISEKFKIVRQLAEEFGIVGQELPDIPFNTPKAAYGSIAVTGCLYLSDLISLVDKNAVLKLKEPIPMEALNVNNNGGQSFGWLLYSTTFLHGRQLQIRGEVFDRAQIFVNGLEIGIIDWSSNKKEKIFVLRGINKGENLLEILVENMGRVNYVRTETNFMLSQQRKGIVGSVYIDNSLISGWTHVPLDFSDSFKLGLGSLSWKPVLEPRGPMALLAVLTIKDQPKDTFLLMKSWQKGIVLINGFNIGRYWNSGPQQTLFVPAPLLNAGRNEIIVFELHQPDLHLNFIDHPVLGKDVEHVLF